VFVVIAVGSLGLYFVLNQKNQTQTNINLSQTPVPTRAIINKPEPTLSPAINMDDFQTMSDGLKIKDETIGSGVEVKSGDTVTVNYLGTLENGTKFDSSYDRNTPFTTQIGVGKVIKGWDEGIVGMKVGGKRKLIIPSSLGYGEQGAGNLIPPNTTLVFEVELLSIK
jgi:peptidylprolyl isomerase